MSPGATRPGPLDPPHTRGGTLPVVELFHSIQGEGLRSGEPATFIRLAGCNLRCTWCDTPYSWTSEGVRDAQPMTIEQLACAVRERAVVLTGGEPMLHRRRLPQLLSALRDHAVEHVTVETNATVFDGDLVDAVDLWSLSPKLPASGERADPGVIDEYLDAARGRVQLKFVVTCDDDLAAMWRLLERLTHELPGPVLVQPDGTRADYDAALRELAERVLADDGVWKGSPRRSLVRVTAQLHRVAWGPAARGV